MKIKLIKNNESVKRRISANYSVVNLLTKQDNKNISFAIGKAKNHCEITKNIKSDRIYFVLKEKLMIMQGNKKFIVQKGDLIFIPKNTRYQFQGIFRAILINSPAFDFKSEKIYKIG